MIVLLFLMGVASAILFFTWGLSLILFALGGSPHMGAIANVPKWIFLFSVFILFYRTRPVEEFLQKIEKTFFN